jgi:hypothetical protein
LLPIHRTQADGLLPIAKLGIVVEIGAGTF